MAAVGGTARRRWTSRRPASAASSGRRASRSDWSWVRLPIFDGGGYPEHTRGVTTMDGVCVLGLPWLYTWGSGRFAGIAQDAAFVAEHLATRAAAVVS